MKYILVENRQTVHLGPNFWQPRRFQEELNDMEIAFTVPIVDPDGYLQVNESLEFIPIVASSAPALDAQYEQLSGPFYTYENNTATETYTKLDIPLNFVKEALKAIAASERYNKEVKGTTTTIQGREVFLDTARGERDIFFQKYLLMPDNTTVEWKFPDCWLTLTKEDLGAIVFAGVTYIQSQFAWELAIAAQIDAATTVAELKAIVIVEPKENPNLPV